VAEASPQVFELEACGPDDPDGSRTATILSAYLDAENTRAFRQRLWKRLAIAALGWLVIATTFSAFSYTRAFIGSLVIAGTAVWAAVLEWLADKRLSGLLADRGSQRPRKAQPPLFPK
jgi:hypothetical protein